MSKSKLITNGIEGPSVSERERIYWQLGFLASTIGGIPNSEFDLSKDDYCGIMTLLYEIGDKIFPEGRQKG